MYARFNIRGWDHILPGWCWLNEPQVEVSTPCGTVSTRGTTVFIPGLLELKMYGTIHDPGMGPCSPRVVIPLRILVWVPTRCGAVSTRGIAIFGPVWSCRCMEAFMTRGWDHILSV